jgi:hypothetical protein
LNIKLETDRGAHVHAAEIAHEGDPPDVIFWDKRVFRYVRTDGVWDQKKHVYREAVPLSLTARQNARRAMAALETQMAQQAAAKDAAAAREGRTITLNLTKPQAEQLMRARERGGYASNKAALVAGLEALDKADALTNDALLAVLARRLRGVTPAVAVSVEQDQRRQS